jgi:hypothetical protein
MDNGLQNAYMAAFFGRFGAKSLLGGRKFVHDINPWKSKLSSCRQIFLSKLIQSPQIVYFNGLLPCLLKESLSKVLST